MKMGVFLKVDGVEGESTDDRHKGEIELTAWSFGVTNAAGHAGGGGGGAGRPVFSDLAVTKVVDKATPLLLRLAVTGRHVPKAVLTVTTTGEAPSDYLVLALEDVTVSSCLLADAAGADRPVENVGLSFRRVTVTQHAQSPDGGIGDDTTFGWDIGRNATI